MSRTTIIRTLDCIAIFLAAHLAFYGFTGLALWGEGVDFGRFAALFTLHVIGFIAPCAARAG